MQVSMVATFCEEVLVLCRPADPTLGTACCPVVGSMLGAGCTSVLVFSLAVQHSTHACIFMFILLVVNSISFHALTMGFGPTLRFATH